MAGKDEGGADAEKRPERMRVWESKTDRDGIAADGDGPLLLPDAKITKCPGKHGGDNR